MTSGSRTGRTPNICGRRRVAQDGRAARERIKVRDGSTVFDRVVTTDYGPIVRWEGEPAFTNMNVPAGAALRWVGHDTSNEFATLYALDRARNCADYVEALKSWVCPGQNFAHADRDGTISGTTGNSLCAGRARAGSSSTAPIRRTTGGAGYHGIKSPTSKTRREDS